MSYNSAENHAKTKALIFGAGFGKRLAPLTETTPKPLIPVCGKALIQYHIEKLALAGVTELVINTHWLAEHMVDVLGNGSQFGVNIQWSYEPVILETGGGMKNALPLLGEEPFLVISADIWTDFPFDQLLRKKLDNVDAHLIMVPNPQQHSGGDFALNSEGYLVDDEQFPKCTYSGIGVYSPEFIKTYKTSESAFPLREPLNAAITSGKVSAELYRGAWEDIGTLERLDALNKKLGN